MAEEDTQETQEQLMERVKKMSPEELQEFQKSRCIFCQIISGRVQSKKIYDDSKVFAILDINPANPGHVLLMPREHYAIMPQVPDDVLVQLFIVAKRLSQVSLKALGAKGTNIVVQNGIAAGQKAQHFMIHLIPRSDNDSLPLGFDKKTISERDYALVKERLGKRINDIFGIKEEPKPAAPALPIQSQERKMPEPVQAAVMEPEKEEEKEAIEDEGEEEAEVTHEVETFITSQNAKRFHTRLCPFGQNIPKEAKILITEDEAARVGKLPCTCVSGKKIPLSKDEAIVAEKIQETNDKVDSLNQEINTLTGGLGSPELDKIARLLGGKR